MEAIINLLIQAIAGGAGGNAVGKGIKNLSLGSAGDTIAGAIGGVGGGQILGALVPAIAGAAEGGGVDIGSIIAQIIGSGAGGAILTAAAGAIKNAMSK